ncbi:MAG: hypothetical protein A3A10_00910 [Candidatus Tagabacteria bacterium RIFCSPLOWO2_01_FULL_42_9]|uniref:VTC domain-containing protein n=1 Tax=Candidatus Tagabacteria bacterium RIFCSPLOWO2_01_FULL_42_9 TaxID=1802296 RepID=A0A1G2LTJ3_9BACT|nr:MAG: hypothetical protein A3A10_00910 [Candidatus Tagabacteria bacterium RIFCSPLOWO2_01_FULL_42_9]
MENEIFSMADSSADEAKKRYERKFFISDFNLPEVISLIKLHPACFRENYPERTINNIYLDSFDMKDYQNNLAGIGKRLKTRIRWYGDGAINEPILEFKLKENLLGSKLSYPLICFQWGKNLNATVQKAIRRSEIPALLKSYLSGLRCSSINGYSRRYYESADKAIRLTLDSDIRFYSDNKKAIDKDNSSLILELKYNQPHDERGREISNRFPFRATKISKYAVGVEKSYLFF